jgi:hypothetical protein
LGTIDRLHAWAIGQSPLRVFTVVVRALLALAFLPSGFVKIVGEPFTALPVSDPVGAFFAGFFSAHGYYRFVGVGQWVAAGLLLAPRTAALGAVVYLPIIGNIFAVTVAIGPAFGGTRLVTGAMVLANLYFLCWDWDRWRALLPAAPAARARHGQVLTALRMLAAVGIGFNGVVATHMARLRHGAYAGPLAMVAVGLLLGVVMLVVTYRRART